MVNNKKEISFQEVVEELLDSSQIFSPVHLHRFSDISPVDLATLKNNWAKVDPKRRENLMEDLEELSDADTLTCFDDLCYMVLEDENPRVRAAAIRLLWETNDLSFSNRLIQILKNDPDETVRSAAASGLGMYVYLGEIDEISQKQLEKVEETLLKVLESTEKRQVRRKSLEALGFSSRPEVPSLIHNAFKSNEMDWRISALFAMGRSADQRWKEQVLASLKDPDPEIRFEAIRAAGELELKSARQPIMEMLPEQENRENEDIFKAIIWSLSQIGGSNVRAVMNAIMDQARDEEEEEFIASAMENLELTEGIGGLGMLNIDLEDEEDDDFDGSIFGEINLSRDSFDDSDEFSDEEEDEFLYDDEEEEEY